MAIDPSALNDLTIDFSELMRVPVGDRAAAASSSSSFLQGILNSLTPIQVAQAFPSYYRDDLPDISNFITKNIESKLAAGGMSWDQTGGGDQGTARPSYTGETALPSRARPASTPAPTMKDIKNELLKKGIDVDKTKQTIGTGLLENSPAAKRFKGVKPEELAKMGIQRTEDDNGKTILKVMPTKASQMTDEQIVEYLKQKASGSEDIGHISAKYESQGKVDTVSSGKGDPGGVSYGKHQLSSNAGTMAEYLKSDQGAKYVDRFTGLIPGTPEFSRVYKQVAAEDPEGFAKSQKDFITATHYKPLEQAAKEKGWDITNPKIQEALYSMSVQHGGAAKIVSMAGSPSGSIDDQVRQLYAARSKYVSQQDIPADTKSSILNNRYPQEMQDILNLSETPANKNNTSLPTEQQIAEFKKNELPGLIQAEEQARAEEEARYYYNQASPTSSQAMVESSAQALTEARLQQPDNVVTTLGFAGNDAQPDSNKMPIFQVGSGGRGQKGKKNYMPSIPYGFYPVSSQTHTQLTDFTPGGRPAYRLGHEGELSFDEIAEWGGPQANDPRRPNDPRDVMLIHEEFSRLKSSGCIVMSKNDFANFQQAMSQYQEQTGEQLFVIHDPKKGMVIMPKSELIALATDPSKAKSKESLSFASTVQSQLLARKGNKTNTEEENAIIAQVETFQTNQQQLIAAGKLNPEEAIVADPSSLTAKSSVQEEQQGESAEPVEQKTMIISMGTNDWYNTEDTYTNAVATINAAKAKGYKVVVVPPRTGMADGKDFTPANQEIMRAVADTGVETETVTDWSGYGGYHPSDEAYKAIADKHPGALALGDSIANGIGKNIKDGKTVATDGIGTKDILTNINSDSVQALAPPAPPPKAGQSAPSVAQAAPAPASSTEVTEKPPEQETTTAAVAPAVPEVPQSMAQGGLIPEKDNLSVSNEQGEVLAKINQGELQNGLSVDGTGIRVESNRQRMADDLVAKNEKGDSNTPDNSNMQDTQQMKNENSFRQASKSRKMSSPLMSKDMNWRESITSGSRPTGSQSRAFRRSKFLPEGYHFSRSAPGSTT